MEVPTTMSHHGPLAPSRVVPELKRKDTHKSQENVQKPQQKTVSIFSSQYILGYNVMNPDEIPRTGPLVTDRPCPPGLNYKERKHWHHQKKFYTKVAGQQEEWLGCSDNEETSVEAAADDESQEEDFIGFSDDVDEEPAEIPRIEKGRTTKDTSSEFEDVDDVTVPHRLTSVRGVPLSPVVEPVLSLVEKDSSRDQKLRARSAPKTSKSRASRYAHLRTRASSVRTSRITPKYAHLRLRVQRQQERSNSSSHQTAPLKPSQVNTRRSSADKSSSKDASAQTILSYSSAASINILLGEATHRSSEDGRECLFSMSHHQIQHSNTRQASKNLSNQDRATIEVSSPCRGGCGIPTSSKVAQFNPTLAMAF
ncbi:hypothetical protein BOTCAL_0261g00100 [Botryotinia calthae]|uniref:Uncharacterized protein n=1 Tax=Botryotinia calthae TaxID=38488 RepID=A0A4Y8CYW7_9HELO|nr:hypothetical protein BOTCAL_0261g00100 [Botryotinia calthae]